MRFGLFGRREAGAGPEGRPEGRPEADRLKGWVRAAARLSEEVGLTVSEIECLDPACPGTETVVLIMAEGTRMRAVKFGAPVAEITEQDVSEALVGFGGGEP